MSAKKKSNEKIFSGYGFRGFENLLKRLIILIIVIRSDTECLFLERKMRRMRVRAELDGIRREKGKIRPKSNFGDLLSISCTYLVISNKICNPQG